MRKKDSGRHVGRHIRASAYLLGVVLVATTLSACASPSVEEFELNNALGRCENFLHPPTSGGYLYASFCSDAQWEKIEAYAERTGQDVARIRRIRDERRTKREAFDRETLDVYLGLCADGNSTWHCRSGGVWGFDYLEAIAEKEGKAKQLRAIREALEREPTPD